MSTDLPDTATTPSAAESAEHQTSTTTTTAAEHTPAGGEEQGPRPKPAPGPTWPAWPTTTNPDAERTHRVDPRSYSNSGAASSSRPGERGPVRQLEQTQLGQQASPTAASAGPPAHALSSAQLLRDAKPVPQTGWRRGVYVATAGLWNPGEGAGDTAQRELATRVEGQPLHGCYRLAFLSLKGGFTDLR